MNPLRTLVLSISRIPPALLLIAIIGIAVGCTLMVTGYVHDREHDMNRKIEAANKKLRGVETRCVFVAKDVEEGAIISSADLEEKLIPDHKMPQDAISASAMATGRIAKYGLMQGQILSQHDLAPIGVSLGFEARLPKGMRAVTFAVDSNSGVAGFVNPDSRVDIMSMVGSGADTKVATILSDVKVIAAGTVFERSTGKTGALPSSSVTVAVSPEDSQKLVKGLAASKLYLSLRNKNDHTPVVTVDVTSLFPKKQADSDETTLASLPAPGPGMHLPSPPEIGDLDGNLREALGSAQPPQSPRHAIEMWSASQRDVVELPATNQQ